MYEFALKNDAILVATYGDVKRIARGQGIGANRYQKVNLLTLFCRETRAAERVRQALTLIEHEWYCGSTSKGRRFFIEIMDSVIRINRQAGARRYELYSAIPLPLAPQCRGHGLTPA